MGDKKKLGAFFVKIDRKPEGCASRAVTLTDDRPNWLLEAIQEVHGNDMPRDWIYQECEAVCDAIDDGSLTDEDSLHEYADGRVDTYTKDRYDWAADMCLSSTFSEAEQSLEDAGGDNGADTVARLGLLQYYACERIARIILEAFENAAFPTRRFG